MLIVMRNWQSAIREKMRENVDDLVAILLVVVDLFSQLMERAFLQQVNEQQIAWLVGAEMNSDFRKAGCFALK